MCKTIPENKSNPSLAEKFARTYAMMHPADAAEHLQDCPLDEQIQFLLRQDINEAAETIAEMEWMDQIELMSQLRESSGGEEHAEAVVVAVAQGPGRCVAGARRVR